MPLNRPKAARTVQPAAAHAASSASAAHASAAAPQPPPSGAKAHPAASHAARWPASGAHASAWRGAVAFGASEYLGVRRVKGSGGSNR
jgi:hypothetical protein